MIAEVIKAGEAQDKKRADEWAARENKI